MNDYQTRIRWIERWSLLSTGSYLTIAIGTLIYLTMFTSDQPDRFFPLRMKEKDSVEQKQQAIDQWLTGQIPDNLDTMLSEQFLETPFAVNPELTPAYKSGESRSFKERLLFLNEAMSWQFRCYWQAVRYWKTVCITAIIVALLAALRLRILTGLLLVVTAVMALPVFAWIFDGPMPRAFSDRTYFLFGALLIPALVSFGLAIYRWRLVPVTEELVNDWQMFGFGVLLTIVGGVGLAVLFVFGGRTRASVGLVPAIGIYLICVRGWRIGKYYFRQNKNLSNDSEQGDANE
jgi:hypothetical protein